MNRRPISPSIHPILKEILHAIENSGRTDRDILARTGYNVNTFNEWRSGRGANPRLHTLLDICQELGLVLTIHPISIEHFPAYGISLLDRNTPPRGDRS